MRILSMDVGDRRIGMAISDPLGWTAQGIETLVRRNNKYDFDTLSEIIERYNPKQIVIGLPRNMNGTLGPQSDKVKKLGGKLGAITNVDIVYWDERLTTIAAERSMIDTDMRREKRKKKVDQIAAVLILQSYLDYINREQE
ncbi:MAG TPA: Holliday junction resolvase RuvX [Bacillota bacterium]|nr:Holliday junction resolvase RuvX [Bacillota bacterium]